MIRGKSTKHGESIEKKEYNLCVAMFCFSLGGANAQFTMISNKQGNKCKHVLLGANLVPAVLREDNQRILGVKACGKMILDMIYGGFGQVSSLVLIDMIIMI